MMADEHPEMGARGPKSVGGSPVSLMIYVREVDAVVKKAVASGAKLTRPVEDKFYGIAAVRSRTPLDTRGRFLNARRGRVSSRDEETSRRDGQ